MKLARIETLLSSTESEQGMVMRLGLPERFTLADLHIQRAEVLLSLGDLNMSQQACWTAMELSPRYDLNLKKKKKNHFEGLTYPNFPPNPFFILL